MVKCLAQGHTILTMSHHKYHFLNMLKIKFDINQQYFKTDDLHVVKSE